MNSQRPNSASFYSLRRNLCKKPQFQMFISVTSERSNNSSPREREIELCIARSKVELENAFRLVYHSYTRAGLQEPNDVGMRVLPQHLLPETDVMIAKMEGTIISTATLIVDSELGLPSEKMYQKEIDTYRSDGRVLAEVGCLADRRASAARFIQMFRRLSTLISQAAAHRGCDGLIAATHPRHARFYIRQLGFKQIGGLKECPYVQGNPAVPLLLDFRSTIGTPIYDHLFGNEYPLRKLLPYQWEPDTRDCFLSVLRKLQASAQGAIHAPVAGMPSAGWEIHQPQR